jgi:hypothetical protein
MHDTAVGSANFTGWMPAPKGDGGRLTATEDGGDWPPPVVGGRLPGIRTSERSPAVQLPVARLGCGMIRFNNYLWATLQDVRRL